MRQMKLQPVVNVTFDGHTMEYSVVKRPEYHDTLASLVGLEVVWMDISAIPDRAKSMLLYRKELHQVMEMAGFHGYVVNGHAQNAKSGMIPWLPVEQRHPFERKTDRIRLGALFTPLWLGAEQRRATVMVTDDNWSGCGDGYGLWESNVTQIRSLVGVPESKGWLDPDTVSLAKGQLGNTGILPTGIDLILPTGVLKGPNVPTVGTIFEAVAMIGRMNEVTRYRAGEWGYMSMQDLPTAAFEMMYGDVNEAMLNIGKFVRDPLMHLNEEWLEGIATAGWIEEDGERVWGSTKPGAEVRQGANWFLQLIAEIYARTGDDSLMHSAAARMALQKAVSMMGVRAINQGGKPTIIGRLIPAPAGIHVDPDDIVMHPSIQERYPDKTTLATRFPNPDPNVSQQGLNTYFDKRVPRGCMVIHETVAGPMSADFDGDDLSTFPVKGRRHWTRKVWVTRRDRFHHNAEKYRAKPAKTTHVMDAWESCANAMSANVGEPTNLHTDLQAMVISGRVSPDKMPSVLEVKRGLVGLIQGSVDLAKKEVELELEWIDKARTMLKELGWKPYFTNYRKYMKEGSKERPNSVTFDGQVLSNIWKSIGTQIPFGAHVRNWLPYVPNPLLDDPGIQNVQFRSLVPPMPGPGYEEGKRVWKQFGIWFSQVRNQPEAQELKREGAERFRAVWRHWSESEDKEWLWQALSACWQEAWQDHGSILRLLDTNVDELANLVCYWIERRRLHPDQQVLNGRLLKVGYETLQRQTQFIVSAVTKITLKGSNQEAISIMVRRPHAQVIDEKGNDLSKESIEMGPFAVMGTWIDETAIGKTITITPATARSSTFVLSFQ